jgi:uncharacterized membrane protein YhhN
MIAIAILCVVVTAGLCIRGKYADNRTHVYIFKPLTTTLVIFIAILSGHSQHSEYWYLIVAGLSLSLAGDVFLMLPSNKFLHGLVSFLGAHIVFAVAFLTVTKAVTPWLLLTALVIAMTLYATLYSGLAKLKIPVLVYVLAIFAMAWRAWENWLYLPSMNTLLAACSTVLFLVSDSSLAFNRFRRSFRSAEAIVLATYFASILLLAVSTGL